MRRLAFLSMSESHIKERLQGALHRGHHKATEEELAEVAAVVLAVVGEITAELIAILADLSDRVTALEHR